MSLAIFTTERAFQDAVIELAQLERWRVAHFRPARTAKGWRTPVAADGAGFPDLVMVRPPRLIFAEIKGPKGKLSGDQERWQDVLRDCQVWPNTTHTADQVTPEVYVWTPSDWDDVVATLQRKRKLTP